MEVDENPSPAGPSRKGIVRSMDFWRWRPPGADDSGIDSDEDLRAARNMAFVNDFMQGSDSSSAEEEGYRYRFRMPHVRVSHKGQIIDNGSHCSEESDDGLDQRYEGPERVRNRTAYCDVHENRDNRSPELEHRARSRPAEHEVASENGRDSPSLLECCFRRQVELTASDEDDDASVLELVIPMQQSARYQRVPSNKAPKKRRRWLFNAIFWCCFTDKKK